MIPVHVYHGQAAKIAAQVRALEPGREVIAWSRPEELARGIGEVRALFVGYPPREGWAGAKELRLIQLMGVGADMLLPSPDLPAEVQVAGLRGLFADVAAEHAVTVMLALIRGLPRYFAQQRDRIWRPRPAPRVAGRTLAVLGLGAIGRGVARRASALGMRVLGVRRRPQRGSQQRGSGPLEPLEAVAGPEALHAVLAQATDLVIALPRTPQTQGWIDAAALAALPRGATLTQLGRGGVLDEAALAAALRSGALSGAALDVFEGEPLSPEDPLWALPGLLITPHVAGLAEGYLEGAVEVLVENLRRLDRGEPLLRLLDREAGY